MTTGAEPSQEPEPSRESDQPPAPKQQSAAERSHVPEQSRDSEQPLAPERARAPEQRPEREQPPSTEARRSLLGKVLAWLRAGYPQGVPPTDYVALLAVLHRRLTDYEVHAVVDELIRERAGDDEIARHEIEDAIGRVAKELPGEDDIARVTSRLQAGGWPLATPTSESPNP
ncbi:DUF3349 domain-containing protein [Nocardia macrotermitis]|uniref:DUF3349 domain-containing protein n=1 Tax=Nocardia macrotermitis TaxID=2585198 RepID=A0A7K0CXP6_9NOCA|nr:DUF3349 domain-containing protein [Nocardia macrotermitis]MQY18275.1 hypothetical protein [Nocardia macrotermitis]